MLKSRFPQIIARSTARVELAVRKAEAWIQAGAQKRSRTDTGTMRAGWQSKPLGAFEGMVFNMVTYTIYNEYGTYKMSAQPMLRPSVEAVRMDFYAEVRSAWE